MTDEIKKQILAIRDTGEVNMLDIKGVTDWAVHLNFDDLYVYLGDNEDEYVQFILTGKTSEGVCHEQ